MLGNESNYNEMRPITDISSIRVGQKRPYLKFIHCANLLDMTFDAHLVLLYLLKEEKTEIDLVL